MPKTKEELAAVSTRVPTGLKSQFEAVAASEQRSLAGELRFIVERRVKEHEAETAKAGAPA